MLFLGLALLTWTRISGTQWTFDIAAIGSVLPDVSRKLKKGDNRVE